MLAKDIMNKIVVAAKRSTLGRDLTIKLLSGMYSGLPVVDEKGRVIGVVSEFDLLKVIRAGKKLEQVTAEEIMTKPPVCVKEDSSIEEIIDLMTKHNIIRIPVIRNDMLVGIISRCDILSSMVEPEFVTVCYE
ncbi:CBS domain-containing protein [Candidatus Kuenenia sp.]|uniref:CBS domain-containing protein n=1 Tax=Candidatus Kuenenia sp. TaxID=2499824 RepID=UPI0032202CDC